jgi:chromosome segregation ATPase
MRHTDTTRQSNTSAVPLPKPIAHNGAIIEQRPVSELPKSDDMFLSPRVLDAGAFGRYTEILKSIIAKASDESRTLEDFCADAEQMISRAADSERTLSERLQAGVRMLRMIDERADRTDQLLDKVREQLPDSQALHAQIDSVIDERMKRAEMQIQSMIEQAAERIAACEQRAENAAQKAESEAAQLDTALDHAKQQLGSIEQRIAEAVLQSEQSLSQLNDACAINKGILEQTFEKSLAHANGVAGTLAQRVDEASRATEARIETISASITPLTQAAEQAMRTLGIDPSDPRFEDSPLARIESLVERTEQQIASIDRVFSQLDDLRSQAETARSEFGRWLIDAADDLDVLESRKDALTGPIQQAAERIEGIAPDLEDKLELASTKLGHLQIEQQALREAVSASSVIAQRATERLTNQSGQLQALLDGSLHKLTQRVEQAGTWLGSLITRAEQVGVPLRTESFAEFTAPSPVQAARETIDEINATIAPSLHASAPDATNQPSAHAATPAAMPQHTPDEQIAIPQPPRLPIDAISFEGQAEVFEHTDDDQDQERSA